MKDIDIGFYCHLGNNFLYIDLPTQLSKLSFYLIITQQKVLNTPRYFFDIKRIRVRGRGEFVTDH